MHIHVYMYVCIFKQMPTLNVWLEIYGQKNTHNLLKLQIISSSFQKLYQCEIRLQTKIQITQQYNESEFKNTYRIKEMITKGKIWKCHFKRRLSEE